MEHVIAARRAPVISRVGLSHPPNASIEQGFTRRRCPLDVSYGPDVCMHFHTTQISLISDFILTFTLSKRNHLAHYKIDIEFHLKKFAKKSTTQQLQESFNIQLNPKQLNSLEFAFTQINHHGVGWWH